ncbi:MAG TPA: hypothetical protein DGT23_26580 [Micromonosporaceae bacterium]|nr:hypothetical protein [Micromonosporaceae bacterium]
MIRPETVAKIALSMPGAHQGHHFDVTDFRVNNKIFCTLPKPGRMGLCITTDEQAALLAEDPKTYQRANGSWGAKGWTIVILATADAQQLRELITDAWRLAAPQKLLTELDEG